MKLPDEVPSAEFVAEESTEPFESNMVEAEIEPELELPILKDGRGVGEKGEMSGAEGGSEAKKRFEIPDSDDRASLDGDEETMELIPSAIGSGKATQVEAEERKDNGIDVGQATTLDGRAGDVQGSGKEKGKETQEEKENSIHEGGGISKITRSTEDRGEGVDRMGTKAEPNQSAVEKQEAPNESKTAAIQTITAQKEPGSIYTLESPKEASRSSIIQEPPTMVGEDELSMTTMMAQRALQLSTQNDGNSSNELKPVESVSEKEDIIMTDENALPVEEIETLEGPIPPTQLPKDHQTDAFVLNLKKAASQLRVIPDSDDEEELSSTRTSPTKLLGASSKDIDISDVPQITTLPSKKVNSLITDLPSSSPQKGITTPLQPANTPTKTTTPSLLPSSPALPSPLIPKRKAPPLTTSDSILLTELKAIKIASLQSRNTALAAEIASKKAQLEEITKNLEQPAAETVKTHIRLLHEYNDVRDVGQGLVGLVADNRGVRIGELYEEFGVGLKD